MILENLHSIMEVLHTPIARWELPLRLMGHRHSCSRSDRWKLGDRRFLSLIVMRERFRHRFGQPLDPCFVPWMGGEELVGLVSSRLLHPFPDTDRFMRIIAGVRGEKQTDIIRF